MVQSPQLPVPASQDSAATEVRRRLPNSMGPVRSWSPQMERSTSLTRATIAFGKLLWMEPSPRLRVPDRGSEIFFCRRLLKVAYSPVTEHPPSALPSAIRHNSPSTRQAAYTLPILATPAYEGSRLRASLPQWLEAGNLFRWGNPVGESATPPLIHF